MSTITVPRADLTSEEVTHALSNGLGPEYNVQPGMRMVRSSFGSPKPDEPDTILVTGSNRVWQAQVRIVRRSDEAELRVTSGGLAGVWLVNSFGIARKIQRVLADAPELKSATWEPEAG